MTATALATTVVLEAAIVLGAVIFARRAWRGRADRLRSATVADVGVAGVLAGFGLGVPAAAVATNVRAHPASLVQAAAAVVMIAGFALFAAAKPAGWLEERAAARTSRQAGLPSTPVLVPPWAVAAVDLVVTVAVLVAVFLLLAVVADHDRWSMDDLQAVTVPAGVAVLAIGSAGAALHYWHQARRVRVAHARHRDASRRYLR